MTCRCTRIVGRMIGMIGTVVLCALVVGLIAQGEPQANPQGTSATPQKQQMAEDVFKDIRLLKGIPVDQFMDTMGFFSASTSLNCTGCHGVASAGGDWGKYADDTTMKTTARRMIVMMNNLNKDNFGGARLVTCYTCHRGNTLPEATPSLAVEYGVPIDDPDAAEVEKQDPSAPSADQVFDKYIQALGGAQRLASLTSFVAKGKYQGYDTDFTDVPVEVFAKAPNLRTVIIHYGSGDSITAYDGRSGWISERDKPVPLIAQTGGNLAGANLDAVLSFPAAAGIKQLRSQWRVGSTSIDDREVVLVVGTGAGASPLKLYFDKESGLLVRQVRYGQLLVGRIPAQIDYSDYREVSGIKMPFRWTGTWVDGRSTTTLTDVQPNVPIDSAEFARPSAAKPVTP